jgi:hypothetical protein
LTDIEFEDAWCGVEARPDEKIDDGKGTEDVVAVVEHRQETVEARAGIGDDARVVAGLVQDRLDDQLPGERIDGGFRPADLPADPLIDQSLGVSAPQRRRSGRETKPASSSHTSRTNCIAGKGSRLGEMEHDGVEARIRDASDGNWSR